MREWVYKKTSDLGNSIFPKCPFTINYILNLIAIFRQTAENLVPSDSSQNGVNHSLFGGW